MTKTIIDAKQAVQDIRSGLDDAGLMKKYGISARSLQKLFAKLVKAGVIAQGELEARSGQQSEALKVDFTHFQSEGFDVRPYEEITPYEIEGPSEANSAAPSRAEGPPVPGGDLTWPTNHVVSESAQVVDSLSAIRQIQATPPETSCRVLVVSRDAELLESLRDILEAEDYEAICVFEESVGSEAIAQTAPDLVITDMKSSIADDRETVARVKQWDESIPTILVTGRENKQEAIERVRDCAYDFVERPVDPSVFLASVRRALERRWSLYCARLEMIQMEEDFKTKTAEIIRAKEFLHGILNSSDLVSVALTDPDQNVLFWNKGAENIFGYSRHEMVGSKISRIYPPDTLTKETVERLREMASGGSGTIHGKMKQLTKNGETVIVSLSLSPLMDREKRLLGIVGIGLDVTEEARQQEEILRLLAQVKSTQEMTVLTLAKLAERRDEETGAHLVRIREYTRAICEGLAERSKYKIHMTPDFCEDLIRSSVLHDIGKVSIPDSVLMFTGKYGPEQYEIMKQHTTAGGMALEEAVNKLGEKSFLTVGMEVAYYHHERWDGTGYPKGLKEEAIPLSARIVALADVYDALTTQRRYKKAYTHEEAKISILDGKGSQFDPEIIEVFVEREDRFQSIRDKIGHSSLD